MSLFELLLGLYLRNMTLALLQFEFQGRDLE
jgi:hypothetical protein